MLQLLSRMKNEIIQMSTVKFGRFCLIMKNELQVHVRRNDGRRKKASSKYAETICVSS